MLCANCHALVHSYRKNAIPVEHLRSLLRRATVRPNPSVEGTGRLRLVAAAPHVKRRRNNDL